MSWIIGLVMFGGLANAATPASCPEKVERQFGTQIQQIWSEGSQSCFFSITPLDAYVDLVYRDLMLTTEGLFMVFNSYGEGPDSETTGAREFYMFPRVTNEFKFHWDMDRQELEVIHVTGDKFIIDARKARLKSITRANVSVANDVNSNNRGGIEVLNYQGILLDAGFRMGDSPTSEPTAKSLIKDHLGNSCSVTNKEVFKYTSGGDNVFKFSDQEFLGFLKKRCPSLNP